MSWTAFAQQLAQDTDGQDVAAEESASSLDSSRTRPRNGSPGCAAHFPLPGHSTDPDSPWFQGAQGLTESKQVAAAGARPGLCDLARPPTYAMPPTVILKSPQDPAEST